MRRKTIVNVAIGASALKVIHCEQRDTDFIIKNSVILETSSNLYLNKDTLNLDFIEDKLRTFFFENKIRNGLISFSLPDYIISNKLNNKQQILNQEYVSSLLRGRLTNELVDDVLENEDSLVFDCQILSTTKFNSKDDADGVTDLLVSYTTDDIIKGLKQMSKRLKMKPAVLESESAGLMRLIDMFEIKDNYLIIDIGEVFTKITFMCGTSSLDYKIMPVGLYKLDGLISSLYNCNSMDASERRLYQGVIHDNEAIDNILSNVVEDVFAAPLIEQLDIIQNMYNGLHFINRFLIAGGAWQTPGFKDMIQSQTLDKFDGLYTLEDFSEFCKDLSFDNEIVKEDVLSNILLYSSCVGLCLRGGI